MRRSEYNSGPARRDHLVRKYEALAYEAERAGDRMQAEHYFQLAENYRTTKAQEQ